MSNAEAGKEAGKDKSAEAEVKKKKFPLLITGLVGLIMGATGFMVPMFMPGLFQPAVEEVAEGEGDHGNESKPVKTEHTSAANKEKHGSGGAHGGKGEEHGGSGGGHGAPSGHGGEGATVAVDGHRSNTPGKPSFVKFGQMIVNLNSNRMDRYLRMLIILQVDDEHYEELGAALENHKVQLKSWLVAYLSDIGLEDIRGTAGQNRLRREIQDQFNTILFEHGYDRIQDVLFEEFTVQ